MSVCIHSMIGMWSPRFCVHRAPSDLDSQVLGETSGLLSTIEAQHRRDVWEQKLEYRFG